MPNAANRPLPCSPWRRRPCCRVVRVVLFHEPPQRAEALLYVVRRHAMPAVHDEDAFHSTQRAELKPAIDDVGVRIEGVPDELRQAGARTTDKAGQVISVHLHCQGMHACMKARGGPLVSDFVQTPTVFHAITTSTG